MRLRKKITAAFLGLALLSIVAGFCDSLIDSARAASSGMMNELAAPDGQMHYLPSTVLIRGEQGMPYDNSLKPCCTDKHTGTPSTQTTNFNAGVKLLPLGVAVTSPSLTSFFENKLASSDSSPPKPDKISSVLRLE